VYGIVKQSGGHITAYSEPGRGAVFKVYLSRVQDAVGAKATPPEIKVAAIGTETILVVEDEAPVRKLMTQILRRHGYTLLEAPTGVDALEAISRHSDPIHLMVTDVVMPGMSGRDLAKRVETMRPQTKVLYISGYTEDAIVHHGELDPGTAFLPKPFTPSALAQKVREILG
jgi:CheY-like chemotaxis protein